MLNHRFFFGGAQMMTFIADNQILDFSIRFAVSFGCGLLMGMERKLRQHAVGIRTLTLICVSSCLLSIMSVIMADRGIVTGDPTRIAAGVVTGIGFIGAGGILRQGFNIRGITTAAIIFTAAAIGLACGLGLYIPALITLGIELITLFVFDKMENKFFPAVNTKVIRLEFETKDIDQSQIKSILEEFNILLLDTDIEYAPKKETVQLCLMVKVPNKEDYVGLAKKFSKLPKMVNFSMTKK